MARTTCTTTVRREGSRRWRVKGIGEHVNKPGIPTTDWDWIIYPEGLFDLLVYH